MIQGINGVFLFNKPSGVSSAGFLNKVKKELHIPRSVKVGHGGTLDPFAQGLIVVAIGREHTKKLHNVLKKDVKEYNAEIILGAYSDTYDCDGNINKIAIHGDFPTDEEIKKAIEIVANRKTQTPPPFSAIKVRGVEAYKRARKGEIVSLPERPAHIEKYKLISIKREENKIVINILLTVGAGFYIRSFANDLGVELGCGAYLNKLMRTKIGDLDIKDALSLEKAVELGDGISGMSVDI